MLFTAEEVLEITSGKLLAGTVPPRRSPGVRRVTTDSREVRPGDLFVALIGEHFNGHDFVEAAVRRGAVGAVVQEEFPVPGRWQATRFRTGRSRRRTNPWIIGVLDPLTAYQQLAAHHRTRFEIPVVAVTGSNGKTTTKEMVACVLAERWPSLKTEGNLNNRIGVPKTVLRLSGRHKACVVEMGVDRRGQTTRLCDIARPTLGLITNIGPDHLEFFGTLDASADAKGELLDGLPEDGAAILNADDPYFPALASRARCPVLSFGLTEAAQVRAEQVVVDPRRGTTFRLRLPPGGRGPERSVPVVLRAYGTHNLANALAAAAVGYALGVSGSVIARGLARFRPAAMRSQVVSTKGIRFINDCYNANPASTKAAVGLLQQLGGAGRTLAVLGDMRELGPDAGTWHREVGRYVAEQGVSYLIACGALGRELAVGAREAGMASDRVLEAADAEGAARLLRPLLTEGDVVLIKASRGMRLERVLELLREGMRGGNSP